MKHVFTAVSLAGLIAAIPVTASAESTPAEDAVVQAFLQFDCVMTRGNEDAVVAAMGLSDDESEAVGQQMLASGQLQPVDDNLVLQHPDCPAGQDAAEPTGVEAAIVWMTSLRAGDAANAVAEVMAANDCVFGTTFEEHVGAAVAGRFGFDMTGLLSEDMDPFIGALVTMSERGLQQLVRDERVEDGPTGITLRDCDAG